ncbi:hypothetical protein TNCV_1058091 [Trichonephila clavipes]|nr:hypothetical protein TNCV_1058091 [Trichonephila clavipes]
MYVALYCYARPIGNGPSNFESQSSDESHSSLPPNSNVKSLDIFNVHQLFQGWLMAMGLEIWILDQLMRMRPKSWYFLPKLPNYVNERSLRWIDLAGIIPSTPNILLKA